MAINGNINYQPNGAMDPMGTYMQYGSQIQQNSQASPVSSGIGQYQMPGTSQANTPLGMNLGTANLALGGISTIGNLWAAWQAQKQAKEQFNFQKGITNTNLANQIQSYNTSLSDRMVARGHTQGDSQGTIDQYIQQNSLKDERT